MSIKQILILTLCTLGTTAFAQTKLITHKSFGSSENFNMALWQIIFFYDENIYFGNLPKKYEKKELDSVILKNDSLVSFIIKAYLKSVYKSDSTLTLKQDQFEITLDPEFFEKNPLDSIKKSLKNQFRFEFKMDNVKYKGFDTIDPCPPDENENSVPFFKGNDNHQNPPSNISLFWLSALAGLLSLLFTLITFRLWQVKNHLVLQNNI